ncbi:MAG: chemotaxis response regulator protein-glutamate methylesterase [Candidatus Scalindua sp. AMX11]|nr:MAG: chemotaxis response regulator protein-glutamate methylesterase [Candidatus Scalindua sp.]NOG85746.1 chemotaxis response regulator protein-glutamate methylesterase [Planctomycetota bacterium]RZV73193.1 MAG: chemotaxis response regulator protein-glutamate methylesterase [Candidatus Scalindua sp. SCAELEC01]TDE64718.1 MAG: chemotaxis response regulator protein-glutamate methylesterase [Candidatus Scalindua sp. AMX11]GJQ58720.1 MAG: chemotaxis response regulator protein-glutamate methylester
MDNKIRVLIIDDSAVIRKILSNSLNKFNDIEIVGTAPDPFIARDKILSLKPDVLTLDIEMPRMDGLTFLKKIMTYHPTPTIMVSSLSHDGCDVTLKALEIGAVDYVAKPTNRHSSDVKNVIGELHSKIRIASRIKMGRNGNGKTGKVPHRPITSRIKQPETTQQNYTLFKGTHKVIVIGASTGGTEALKEVLVKMPAESPGIVIVQHMPEIFTKAFAQRLDSLCAITVTEGRNGDSLTPGKAIIAPGNYHMKLRRNGAMYHIETTQEERVHHQRPAADVLFESAAKYAGINSVGVILTGMGADGASGLLKMKQAGAKTIAQDEESCVVFGMPKEAIKIGAVDKTVTLQKIPESIFAFLRT